MSARDADDEDDRDHERDRQSRARRDVLDVGDGALGDGRIRRERDQVRPREGRERDRGEGERTGRRLEPRYADRRQEDDSDEPYDDPRGGSRRDDSRRDDNRRDGGRRDGGRRDDEPGPREARREAPAGPAKGKEDGEPGDKDAEDAQGRRKGRRPVVIAIATVVALLLVAGGIYYWLSHRDLVETDDAYTDGRAVAIAPRISGQVIGLDVTDNQFVHKGDPLIRIDPRQYVYDRDQAKGAVESARAQIENQGLGVEIAKKNYPASLLAAQGALTSAKANLLLQQSNYDRQKGLPKQATTQQEVDTSTSNYQQAQAQVEQAQARVTQAEPVQQNIGQAQTQISQLTGQAEQAQGRLDQAELNIEWTVVRAPQDGWVTRRNVEVGNYVSSGTQIMSLVSPDIWVTANFKETELNGMRPGQRVTITVDAHPDLDLRGHVDSIQRGSGSKFSAFPAENATGNFVKIVQRVPVKIVIDSGLTPDDPIPLGISVTPTVMLR